MKWHYLRAGLLLALGGSISAPAHAAGGLKTGEYACYGAGGEALMGLGFKVLDGSHYNNLDGNNPGTYSVNGDTVAFHGGNLDGQTGRGLQGQRFVVGSGINCEPSG